MARSLHQHCYNEPQSAVNYDKPTNRLGELYNLVTLLLERSGCWDRKSAPFWPFELCLGECVARGLPFRQLARIAARSMDTVPLLNFYEKFKCLTWKVDMVETLRNDEAGERYRLFG